MYYQSFDTLASFSPIAHLLLTTNRQVLRSEVSLPAFFGGVSGLQRTPGHDARSSQQENLLPPWTMAGCVCVGGSMDVTAESLNNSNLLVTSSHPADT